MSLFALFVAVVVFSFRCLMLLLCGGMHVLDNLASNTAEKDVSKYQLSPK